MSSKHLHSPGPWAIDSELPPTARDGVARVNGELITCNAIGCDHNMNDRANLVLMVLAPELMDLVQTVALDEAIPQEHRAAAISLWERSCEQSRPWYDGTTYKTGLGTVRMTEKKERDENGTG